MLTDTLSTLFASIDYRDPLWIAVAYVFGFLISRIGLPPLVGFLLAGFSLTTLGASGGEFLHEMADLGVTLLLFTIGLKLNIRQLLRAEIWGVAIAHITGFTLGVSAIFWLLAGFGVPLLASLSMTSILVLAFALSFSSTVFAVKVFEARGGSAAQYARVAIGVLIIQDIAAVIFLTASVGKLPSIWAAPLIIGLLVCRPILVNLLKSAGHGELLILFGLVMALGGSSTFELVGLKGDLGALFFGILLANNSKSTELNKALVSFKDLFLVGFFLSIGMAVAPTSQTLTIAILLVTLLPFKSLLFYWLFSRFKLRTRQATFASLALGNFSEFGLIITAIATQQGWLHADWLVVMALIVVLSFIIAAPMNARQNPIFRHLKPWLQKLEHSQRLPEDDHLQLDKAHIIICGMGRIGCGAYDYLREHLGDDAITAVDFDQEKSLRQTKNGYSMIYGDSSNPEFWARFNAEDRQQITSVLLCMPNKEANMRTAEVVRAWGYKQHLSAVIKFADEEPALQSVGVDTIFNLYGNIGSAFAHDALHK